MIGMDAATGVALAGDAHLAQSIGDILSTPIGTRVMRRDYGSMLFELIDAPLNAATKILLFAATALALRRWEPRLLLTRVGLAGGPGGVAVLSIEGTRTDTASNSLVNLTVPLRAFRFQES